jgi:Flp pilus assembly protein TadB
MTRAPAEPVLGPAALVELRAALAAGATPGTALAEIVLREDPTGPLARVARDLRLGSALPALAGAVETGDAVADLLVRALAVAERTGGAAAAAVDRALASAREESLLRRLLAVRTAQARGTARVLSAVPVGLWLLLVGLDPTIVRFYARPLGLATGLLALGLAAAGNRWARRVVATAEAAACGTGRPRAVDLGRLAAVGLPAATVGWLLLGPAPALLAGAVAGVLAARSARTEPPEAAPADVAEVADLLALAIGAGLGAPAALTVVADLVPGTVRAEVAAAGRRAATGRGSADALGGALTPIGAVLAAGERWGAPVAPALGDLAADLRAQRRAAAEEAAERAQLALVFPTTLLTLPAFVLAVVPPLLWAALGAA